MACTEEDQTPLVSGYTYQPIGSQMTLRAKQMLPCHDLEHESSLSCNNALRLRHVIKYIISTNGQAQCPIFSHIGPLSP